MPAPFPSPLSSTSGHGRHIAVVGAGIVGVTTAYELAARGHQVTVYDRRESVGAESSFANAGLLSPGSVSPASAPGLRPWLLRGLWSHEAALRWRPSLSRSQWAWLRRWWQACSASHPLDVRAMVSLAHSSQQRRDQLTQQLGLQFERSQGVLLLLNHEREFRPTRRHVLMLRELGVAAEELTPDRCREVEPGLGSDNHLAGGVLLPNDGVGNCRQFTQLLRDFTQSRTQVSYQFNTGIVNIDTTGPGVVLHLADNNAATAWPQASEAQPAQARRAQHDAVVLCTGSDAGPLARALGWRLPLQPVYGHSITLPLQADGLAPRSAVVDARSGVAITRMGSRVRVTGGFALGAHQARADEAALRPLWQALDRWFPHAAHRHQVQQWTGARPMLPQGPPIIGALPGSPSRGQIWLNLGHGAHGWTLANGSAALLADLIDQRETDIDPTPFDARRWFTSNGRAR